MLLWQYIFVFSCFFIFYNYAGYAIIVYLINRIRNRKIELPSTQEFAPSVSFIVAAYNEEDFIEKKIINSLSQEYPLDKIEFIFITDGSSDKTPELVQQHARVKLLHQPERKGKSAALNRAIAFASNDILIASDANTLLNKEAVANICRHYQNPSVGGVAGEKKIIHLTDKMDEVGQGEGLYWKYESWLKKIDAEFYSVVGAAGELFSLRRELYEPLSSDIILDDFVISLKVVQQGFSVRYEPDAFAMELPSFSMKDEQKRKIRIAAGGFQAIGMLSSLLYFWKHFRLSFLYISHRVLRWTLTPICLIVAFISNLVLLLYPVHPLFIVVFALQVLFYAMAITASFIEPAKRPGLLKLPYYFTFMNISVIRGFFRFIRGNQSSIWEKAKRIQTAIL